MGEPAVILQENELENGTFINKAKRKSNFTMVTNKIFSDGILSAQGIALYMLIAQKITLPEFILYKTTLRRTLKKPSGAPMGKRAFQTVWDELKNAGYLKQYRIRTSGGFLYQYELLEEPSHARTNLINVKLCEELVEDENGNYVVRNMARVEEESMATTEDLQTADRLDMVGTPKNIKVTKELQLTDEEKKYVREYYEKPEKHYVGEMYIPDPKFAGNSPEIEWKKQKAARQLRQQELLNTYMPQLFASVQVDRIKDEDDKKIGEEIMDSVKDLVAPPDNKLIPIGGIGWPQHEVLNNLIQKLTPDVLDRTIYQIKNYDKKILNYRSFIKTTLYNNIRTYNTWFRRNFETTYNRPVGETDDDFMKINRI